MTIPAGPPRTYTTSRQLIAGDDFNNLSSHVYGFQSVLATGSTQGTAAQITASNVEVTGSVTDNLGVILPIAIPGQVVSMVNNNTGAHTKVYPQANGDVIQNSTTGYAAANTAISVATLVPSEFWCVKKGFWQVTKSVGP